MIFNGFISNISTVSLESLSVTSALRCFAALVRSCLPTCQSGPIGRPETSVNKTTNQSCVTTRKTSATQWRKPEISHGSSLLLPTVRLRERVLGMIWFYCFILGPGNENLRLPLRTLFVKYFSLGEWVLKLLEFPKSHPSLPFENSTNQKPCTVLSQNSV